MPVNPPQASPLSAHESIHNQLQRHYQRLSVTTAKGVRSALLCLERVGVTPGQLRLANFSAEGKKKKYPKHADNFSLKQLRFTNTKPTALAHSFSFHNTLTRVKDVKIYLLAASHQRSEFRMRTEKYTSAHFTGTAWSWAGSEESPAKSAGCRG